MSCDIRLQVFKENNNTSGCKYLRKKKLQYIVASNQFIYGEKWSDIYTLVNH